MHSQSTTASTGSRIFLLVATIVISFVVVIISTFWRIDHSNFWAQTIYLSLLGMSGLELGSSIESRYRQELRQLKWGEEAGMGPTGSIITSLFICCALLGLLQLWWSVAWGSNQSSFWPLTQVGLVFAAINAIIGAQSAF